MAGGVTSARRRGVDRRFGASTRVGRSARACVCTSGGRHGMVDGALESPDVGFQYPLRNLWSAVALGRTGARRKRRFM